MKKLYDIYKDDLLKKAEAIQRLRLQVAVHSYIFSLHKSIVANDVYDNWVNRLDQYREEDKMLYDEVCELMPLSEEKIIQTANFLMDRNTVVEKPEVKVKKSKFKKRLF